MTPAFKDAYARYLKHSELLSIEWDDTTLQECARVRARTVQSDFETEVQKDIAAWIKKQPAHKCWAGREAAAQEFWKERLN